jgi:hypothetical protein
MVVLKMEFKTIDELDSKLRDLKHKIESIGKEKLTYEPEDYQAGQVRRVSDKVLYFKYTSKYPHAGAGSRIQF